MIRVLLTGGAGYIGSHTAKELARQGFDPVVLDDLSTGHKWAAKWGQLIHAPIQSGAVVREVIRSHKVEAVVHFAANAYVGESMRHPRKYFRNNVVNGIEFLDAVLDCNVRCVVFSSSCTIYGTPDSNPIAEGQPERPISPYGESKAFVEKVLGWYGVAYGLRWVSLRYFNAAGADPERELGEDHRPETHLIPLAIRAALGRQPAIELYGTDYPTPDGTAVRDYVHVSDLAAAHVLALRYLLDGGANTILNLGTGSGRSVREIIAAVAALRGEPLLVREAPRRVGDPPILVANPSRAFETLGWAPRYSDLESIVETALRWHSAQPHPYLHVGRHVYI